MITELPSLSRTVVLAWRVATTGQVVVDAR